MIRFPFVFSPEVPVSRAGMRGRGSPANRNQSDGGSGGHAPAALATYVAWAGPVLGQNPKISIFRPPGPVDFGLKLRKVISHHKKTFAHVFGCNILKLDLEVRTGLLTAANDKTVALGTARPAFGVGISERKYTPTRPQRPGRRSWSGWPRRRRGSCRPRSTRGG